MKEDFFPLSTGVCVYSYTWTHLTIDVQVNMFYITHQLLLFLSLYSSQCIRRNIFLEENRNKAKGSKATTLLQNIKLLRYLPGS